MAKKIPIGNSDFMEIIQDDYLYVDKSDFVSAVLDDSSKVIVITRPRRWGKSLNLSMLHCFLSPEVTRNKTQGLFDRLKIAQSERHMQQQGQHPVIYLNFKELNALDFEGFVSKMRLTVMRMYSAHYVISTTKNSPLSEQDHAILNRCLLNWETLTIDQVEDSLRTLTELLYKFYNKRPYVLIDEYDAPLNSAFDIQHAGQENTYFDAVAKIMRNFLSAALKDNTSLAKGVLTGILRISRDSMLSGLNNLQVYTTLDDFTYAPFFGFTEYEIDELFKDQNLIKDGAEIKNWYNGYVVNDVTLYNPWSIISCLKRQGEIGPYWLSTGSDRLVHWQLTHAPNTIKSLFMQLLTGHACQVTTTETMLFKQVKDDPRLLWNLLISTGYLKVLASRKDGDFYQCTVAIPNQEVMSIYRNTFKSWAERVNNSFQFFDLLISSLLETNVPAFIGHIEELLESVASFYDTGTQPEAFYQGFMLCLAAGVMNHFAISSNKESGFGRPDLVLVPKNRRHHRAYIIEFKAAPSIKKLPDTAKLALQQIQDKNYQANLKQYRRIKDVVQLGIAFHHKRIAFQQAIQPVQALLTIHQSVPAEA